MIFIYNRIGGIFIVIGLAVGFLLAILFNHVSVALFGIAITWIGLGWLKFRTETGDTYRGTLFFIPIYIWGIAVMALGVICLGGDKKKSEREEDMRFAYLKEDCQMLLTQQYSGMLSVSKNIDQTLQIVINAAARPQSFHYLVRSNEDKVLVLVQVPRLHKITKDARAQLFPVIEQIIQADKQFANKQLYIGLHGDTQLGGAHTPEFSGVGFGVGQDELLSYYGDSPVITQSQQASSN